MRCTASHSCGKTIPVYAACAHLAHKRGSPSNSFAQHTNTGRICRRPTCVCMCCATLRGVSFSFINCAGPLLADLAKSGCRRSLALLLFVATMTTAAQHFCVRYTHTGVLPLALLGGAAHTLQTAAGAERVYKNSTQLATNTIALKNRPWWKNYVLRNFLINATLV
jgi:hypothetical protein